MASHSYMTITGKRQGLISTGCSGQSSIGNKCQSGHLDEGLISAWQGLQELRAEHEELLSKALFYTQNGIGVLAGGMQIEVGIAVTGASWGIGVVPGVLLMGHGQIISPKGWRIFIAVPMRLVLKVLLGAAIKLFLGIVITVIWRIARPICCGYVRNI